MKGSLKYLLKRKYGPQKFKRVSAQSLPVGFQKQTLKEILSRGQAAGPAVGGRVRIASGRTRGKARRLEPQVTVSAPTPPPGSPAGRFPASLTGFKACPPTEMPLSPPTAIDLTHSDQSDLFFFLIGGCHTPA